MGVVYLSGRTNNQTKHTMNITRAKAESVAYKLTQGLREQAKSVDEQARQTVLDFVDKATPKEVKEFRAKYPDWSRSEEHEKVQGCSIYVAFMVNWRKGELRVDEKTADTVTKLKYKSKDLDNKATETYDKIVNTLLSIKTYNRCKDAFPEAYALLPEASERNLPVVQVDSIRDALGLPSPSIK
jgi:hypothetical protein